MKIKAKQIFLVGAFIVLTIIGYIILPKDEIIIDLNQEQNLSNNSDETNLLKNNSGSKKDVIYVHIEGAVNNPGVKEVIRGTRIFELIELASGELKDADLSKINLASVLKDEQKIYVPYKTIETSTNTDGAIIINKNTQSYSSAENKLVNINTANLEELQKLDGIGPSMAQKIVNHREQNGYFSSIEDIKNVSGIGETKYNKIKENITI